MRTSRQRGRICGVVLLSATLAGCGNEPAPAPGNVSPAMAATVRPAAVAGTFYERSPERLRAQIAQCMEGPSGNLVTGRVVAAVVPHAGYVFSGRCAGQFYRLLTVHAFRRVVILGPSHYAAFRGIAVPGEDVSAWHTPLGDVPVDQPACARLRGQPGFVTVPGADAREHSIEVQVPFLQERLGPFTLVPLLVGMLSPGDEEALAGALASLMNSETLLLASSDFTHYGPNYGYVPFDQRVAETLVAWLDQAAGEVATLDVEGFRRHCSATGDTICGENGIRVLMTALKSTGRPVSGRVLSRYCSGDLMKDYRNSVSYAAIVFSEPRQGEKEIPMIKEHKSGKWSPELTVEEQRTVFAIARDTLAWCVQGSSGRFDFSPYGLTPKLKEDCATFVTLKIAGNLRGCIGSLEALEPLYLSVHHNAINAALRDPRFHPVQAAELPRITLDVSMLSPSRPIAAAEEFVLGEQGIIMARGAQRAVFLPEVAPEQGWTREDTLEQLGLKGWGDPGIWKSGAKFRVFESVVLSEE